MARDVSILIVTYECAPEARACLESIHTSTTGVDFEVVVVDNASSDGTAELVGDEFPHVRLLALGENIGFAAACNLAASVAEGEHLMLLNPDTIVHEGAVESFVEFARSRPEHGLYGGRTLRPDGRVDPGSCWAQPSLWSVFCFATMLSTAFKNSRFFDPESLGGWQRDTVREVGIVTGCLLLARREVWDRLGGFDLRFFMYGEDADLSLRAIRAGYRPAITPDVVITHEVGVSSRSRPDKVVLLLRGKTTLLRKHWAPGKRELGLALIQLGVALRALLGRLPSRRPEKVDPGAWREVWRARRTWLPGYPEPTAAERAAHVDTVNA